MYVNHKDNGIQPPDEMGISKDGMRYEAEFTILEALTLDEAIYAFSRQINDPELDRKVIDNIEVDGTEAIAVRPEFTKVVKIIEIEPVGITKFDPLNPKYREDRIIFESVPVDIFSLNAKTILIP